MTTWSEWLRMLASFAVGGVVVGIIALVGDWLRHRRFARERTIERVIELRLTAYNDLWRGLMRASISLTSFPYEAEDSTVTKGLKTEMVEVGTLLLTGDIWLSPKIAQISWKYLPALEYLVKRLEDGAVQNKSALQDLLLKFLNELGEGIGEEFKAAGVKTISMAKKQKCISESRKILQSIAPEEKANED